MCYQPYLVINISLQATPRALNSMALQRNDVKIYRKGLLRDDALVVKLTILSKIFQRFVKKIT